MLGVGGGVGGGGGPVGGGSVCVRVVVFTLMRVPLGMAVVACIHAVG